MDRPEVDERIRNLIEPFNKKGVAIEDSTTFAGEQALNVTVYDCELTDAAVLWGSSSSPSPLRSGPSFGPIDQVNVAVDRAAAAAGSNADSSTHAARTTTPAPHRLR